ncbi:MAG: hypothetical protein ACJA0N_000962 [Pseudohongiellaceae bacterium]|jgi:hypothetical protein
MKTSIALVISLTLSNMAMSAVETKYSVKGHGEALSICQSIVKDDTVKLSAIIKRSVQNDRLKSHYLKNSSAVLNDYSCNNLSLMKFANRVNAYDSAQWLSSYKSRGSSIFMDELTSSEQNEELSPNS